MCYLRPIIAAVDWWTTVIFVMPCAHPSRRCSPIPFRLHTSQLWLWLRFSLKTQPWTLFQGAYRAVFVTAGNNYLKQPEPPFRQIISYIKIMWELIVVKNTTAPKIRRFRCCQRIICNYLQRKRKWQKSCKRKTSEKSRNQKKSNKNRIRNIKIIASKKRKKTQNRKIYDFFCPDPVIITVSPKS